MICHLMASANCAVYRFFTAYVVIRTVPQSIYGQTRGKKKRRRGTHLRPHTRTKQKTAPTRDALPSGRVSTSKYWWKGTEKSFTKCTRLLENIRDKAKALLRPNSSSTLLVTPCQRLPLSSRLNYCTASTLYLTRGRWRRLPSIWRNRRNGSQRCADFILQTYMLGKPKESQLPLQHQEWKMPYRKCNNSCQTWRRR